MPTILVILAIWTVLSIPLSVVVGFSLREKESLDLVGMDGENVVFRRADGTLHRLSLADRTAA